MPTLRLRFPSNRTLANICVYGAVASVSAVMYMHWSLQDRIRRTDYFRLAFNTLRHHKGAVSLLGEPIKDSGFDLTNTNNTCDAEHAHFEVKVRGPKDRGTVYFWATNNNENGWLIDRLELETKQHPNKRFLLKRALDDQASKHFVEAPPASHVTPNLNANAYANSNVSSDNNVNQHPISEMPPSAPASEPSVRSYGNDVPTNQYQHQQQNYELPASNVVSNTPSSSPHAAAHVNIARTQQQINEPLYNASDLSHETTTNELSSTSPEHIVDGKLNASESKQEGPANIIDRDQLILIVNEEGSNTNKYANQNQNHYDQ